MFRYDEPSYAYQHLSHTVVMKEDGEPVFLRATGQDSWNYKAYNLNDEHAYDIVDIREAGLSFAPIQLGYVNHGSCSYVIRQAARMWKQGLSFDHIKAKTGYLDDNLLYSIALRNTIVGQYPSMEHCYDYCYKHGESIAFNRDFCFKYFDGKVNLEYKGDIIGLVNDDGDFLIDDKFYFVKEQLTEVLNVK